MSTAMLSNSVLPTAAEANAALTFTSSQRLQAFLSEHRLHKKDFADMIGVTLSYVYNLIDETLSFSSRTITLERIAVVMETMPESFPEYKNADEPRLTDAGLDFLKARQRELGMSNLQLIKRFPKTRRLEVVDMWRGAVALPLDWTKLQEMASILELDKEEIYPYWQARMQLHLSQGGIDPFNNMGLLNAMFTGIKQHLRLV